MQPTPQITFSNGDLLPQLGLGTWQSKPGAVAAAVKAAIRCGYRHLDCAAIYGNEAEIGTALAELFADGEIQREELWITSKLWNNAHTPEAVKPTFERTLRDLQLDYLDLYLMHWPVASDDDGTLVSLHERPLLATWTAMEALRTDGTCRHIGVSNFSVKKLAALLADAEHPPEMNQVEMHPYLQQQALVDFCAKHNIVVTAYSPLGSPGRPAGLVSADDPVLMQEPVVVDMAAAHGVTPAQVLLRWALQRGTVVIPKSVTPTRIVQNLAAVEVVLSPADMARMTALDRHRRFVSGTFWVREGGAYTLESLWDE